jgi:hypothetical protein
MKTRIGILIVLTLLIFQVTGYTQDKLYKDGAVWTVGFIKVGANMGRDYLNSLQSSWKAVHEEAVRQGLIVSYKILHGSAANPDDWDIMLLTEYKDLASMDGQDDKWDAIEKKVMGSEDNMKKLNETRVNMRTIYGTKLLREVIFK